MQNRLAGCVLLCCVLLEDRNKAQEVFRNKKIFSLLRWLGSATQRWFLLFFNSRCIYKHDIVMCMDCMAYLGQFVHAYCICVMMAWHVFKMVNSAWDHIKKKERDFTASKKSFWLLLCINCIIVNAIHLYTTMTFMWHICIFFLKSHHFFLPCKLWSQGKQHVFCFWHDVKSTVAAPQRN